MRTNGVILSETNVGEGMANEKRKLHAASSNFGTVSTFDDRKPL